MRANRAPVTVFVYNRPDHTARTLAALAANDGAAETDVVVYADGAHGGSDLEAVAATRAAVRRARGFRSLELIERPRNLGLAGNIVAGVTETMTRAGRTIVLEDDIETARGFLDFMNAALVRYRGEPRVWHVSGWTCEIDPAGLPPYFFWSVMHCWGWASWSDRWAHYARQPDRLVREWPPAKRQAFDLNGSCDFFSQVEDNLHGRITTWAVFWYATIFEAAGLCLNPTVSFTRNIGHDGSGTHCGRAEEQPLDSGRIFAGGLPGEIAPDPEAIARASAVLAVPRHRRMARSLRRTLGRIFAE